MKTTVVGSYPVPDWLKRAPDEEALGDALTVVMDAQLRAGIDVISDGELDRWDLARNAPGGMVERFVRPLDGVQAEPTRRQLATWAAREEVAYRRRPPGVVVGPLGEGGLDLQRGFDRARALTDAPLKLTLSSPYLIARVLADDFYHDFEALLMAVAGVLAAQLERIEAAVIQVDEPHLPGNPEGSELAAAAINLVLRAAPPDAERAVHLCYGNYLGQTVQRGSYDKLLGFLDALECHHLVLETTRRPPADIERLGEVRSGLQFAVGVVDVKDLQIEDADTVAQRIEQLAQTLGEPRIAYVNPDCGLGVLPRRVADGKLRALVAGRERFLGRGR